MHRTQRIIGERIYTIYKATNLVNGKSYVGFDSKWPRRKMRHINGCKSENSIGPFHRAMRKYGVESFEWEVLYQSKDGQHTLDVMEPHFIEQFSCYSIGYNLTRGGDGVLGCKFTRTLEQRQKHAAKLRGRKLSPEHIAKLVEANKKRRHSEEVKKKISAKHIGMKHSDATREKLRKAALARDKSTRLRTPETKARMSIAQLARYARERTNASD